MEKAIAPTVSDTSCPETRTSLACARQELAHESFLDTESCSVADIWQDSPVAIWLGTPPAKKREFNFKVFFFTNTMNDPVELGRRLDDIAESPEWPGHRTGLTVHGSACQRPLTTL